MTHKRMIPFNEACLAGKEIEQVLECFAHGHISGNGPFTKKCEALMARVLGAPRVLLTTSCTHALEMAALLLRIAPGDEVIVPSFTFVSTVNAFVLRGAKPVFADIREDTLNLDERRLEGLITPRTRAIVPVHYAGVGCHMKSIMRVARRHGIAVVEDNAHGFMGKYDGRPLGTFGALAALSFHETKNLTCGEGGALVLNDPSLVERAEILRDKGTDRAKFFRGEVDKYSWRDVGSSYVLSDILAALLYAQLRGRARIQKRRQAIWKRYYQEIQPWAARHEVKMPCIPPGVEHPAHLFYLVFPAGPQRDKMIAFLKSRGVLSVFHYVPLHLSPMGRRFGGRAGDCPVTESVSRCLLRLPMYVGMTEREQSLVIRLVQECPL